MMPGQSAIVISGTAPNSLGEQLVRAFHVACPGSPILVIDKRHNPSLVEHRDIYAVAMDLNPFTSVHHGYNGLANDLDSAIEQAMHQLNVRGITTAVLAAGTYESGSLLETSIEERQRLIGVNVCGKIELLHATLAVNQRREFPTSEVFTLVDIGTLRSQTSSSRRSVYAATKALGLDLCMSMQRDGEIKRAIHFALGPVDTPMLHRNHWVSKEHGSVKFFKYVRERNAKLYRDVFMQCDDAAFEEVVSSSCWNLGELAPVFARYKDRRKRQFADRHGVLPVAGLADHIVAIVANAMIYTDGVYTLTAPNGQVQTKYLPFSDVAL